MKQHYVHTYDKEQGLTTCTMNMCGITSQGTAKCHPDDADMQSRLIGENISFCRAYINWAKAYRKKLVTEYNVLNQLFTDIKTSKKYNKNGYETRMLRRRIAIKKQQIKLMEEIIEENEQEVKDYIESKEEFWKLIRAKCNRDKTE